MTTPSQPRGTDTPDPFAERLARDDQTLERVGLESLQLNLGKLCNMACHHCHVEAGPKRTEVMSWATMRRILHWLDDHRQTLDLQAVDLTGGAPEMNPCFRRLVRALRARGHHVLDRCNLTILLERGNEGLIGFLARYSVEIVASLPCYLETNVDRQRGRGALRRSVEALRRLNAAGYGQPGSGLRLDLVYNPVEFALPGDQGRLEIDYRRELGSRFGTVFNNLWAMTNMPIKRFAWWLRVKGRYESYLDELFAAHNPANVERLMCRHQVNIGWQGGVYDCDFGQMLALPIAPRDLGPEVEENDAERWSVKLWELTPRELIGRRIRSGVHCFGCTAGAGSSCTGVLDPQKASAEVLAAKGRC